MITSTSSSFAKKYSEELFLLQKRTHQQLDEDCTFHKNRLRKLIRATSIDRESEKLIMHLEAIKDPQVCSLAEKVIILQKTADMVEGKILVTDYLYLVNHVQGKPNNLLRTVALVMIVLATVAYCIAALMMDPVVFYFPLTITYAGVGLVSCFLNIAGMPSGLAQDINYLGNRSALFSPKHSSQAKTYCLGSSPVVYDVDLRALHPEDKMGSAEQVINQL